jgi:hypothetical protein
MAKTFNYSVVVLVGETQQDLLKSLQDTRKQYPSVRIIEK